MSLTEKLTTYLNHYSNKNIVGISEMLADDVALRDWKISVSGKATAIAETEKNFSSVETIEIEILHIYEAELSIAAELRIIVNKTEVLYVVDVIVFNEQHKIQSIRAYLGRSD